ncbi:MAG: hypothetical protein A3F68_10555 [Acidobacteria bacterium RIFCSPLOWO2_12_FULL_54_10]|nr:MAG: hypothetical protein A3F68_10555 [Acidobacteria bacterium RIFCSPLOWO2_12_FULL_54_10]
MIKSAIQVQAPKNNVYTILTDFSRYKEWVPGCESCAVTSQSGNVCDTQIVINSMKRMEMGLRFDSEPVHSIKFRMTKGKELKAYAGTYRLMDSADGLGTVVLAELDIDAGFMVPKFMVDKICNKLLDDTGTALRKYISSAPMKAAPSPAAEKAPSPEAKRRPVKRLLSVVQTAVGYKIWVMGQTYTVKSEQG